MDLINTGVNIIAFKKFGKIFAMSCSTTMQLEKDEFYVLLNIDSDTCANIELKDFVGVSSLSDKQIDIALKLGKDHSLSKNKIENIDYFTDNMAVLIKNAKVMMKCEVISISHLNKDKSKKLILLRTINVQENKDLSFLSIENVIEKPYL